MRYKGSGGVRAADGKDTARHEGFMAKADILAQWTALGVGL